ncbi:MAG: DUF1573 domain-containing protein [Bacteroidota bacterium]
MKTKILMLFALTFLGVSVMANAPASAKFSWSMTNYDFGVIPVNKPATATFNFVNEGEAPLVISQVKAGCGCTVASYTREAIPPGASGTVEATYNAAKVGAFNKSVVVYANTEGEPIVLRLKGTVQ